MLWDVILRNMSAKDFQQLKESVADENRRRYMTYYLNDAEKKMSKIDAVKSIRNRTGLSIHDSLEYFKKVEDQWTFSKLSEPS